MPDLTNQINLTCKEAFIMNYFTHTKASFQNLKAILEWLGEYDFLKTDERWKPTKSFIIYCCTHLFPFNEPFTDLIKLSMVDCLLTAANCERIEKWTA